MLDRHEIHALPEAGIYRIVNERNGKIYIGASVNMRQRLSSHRNMLRRNVHNNMHLKRAWAQDSEARFVFEAIVTCTIKELSDREQWWIDYYRSNGALLYNQRSVQSSSNLGLRMSDESRAKMSAAKQRMSIETKAKIGAANRRYAEEHPEEISSRRKGIKFSEEGKAKLRGRIPWNKGKLFPQMVGNRHSAGKVHSPEVIARRAAGNSLAWADPEKRARRMAGFKSALTPESRQRRSEGAKKFWARRKGLSSAST